GEVARQRLLIVAGATPGRGVLSLRALARPNGRPEDARTRLGQLRIPSSAAALFLLSGGTTGLPKLIPPTPDPHEDKPRRNAEICGFGSGTVYLAALPAAHNFPLACPGILGTLMAGGRVVLASSPDPDRVFPLMTAERVTATAVVPAVAQRWIEAAAAGRHIPPASLRLLQVGGARLPPEVARQVTPVLGAG